MRSKLLSYLYQSFDKDPAAASALTLSHAAGVQWSVSARRLIVSTEAGLLLANIDLSGVTVNQAAATLTAAGVSVSHINSDLANLSAITLIEGSGTESGYTNTISGHKSILWALIDAYATEVQVAVDKVPPALMQARLHSADGEWLDFWGGYFGISRLPSQLDADYLALIIKETTRLRSNKFAIENAIKDATGHTITIDEPWKRIFILDTSTLSGSDKFKDGTSIGRNLIRPISAKSVDWSKILPVINRNRSAGVVVLSPEVSNTAMVAATMPAVTAYSARLFSWSLVNRPSMRLDIDALDDKPGMNYPTLHRRDLRYAAYSTYLTNKWVGTSWGGTPETWRSLLVIPTVVLSNRMQVYAVADPGARLFRLDGSALSSGDKFSTTYVSAQAMKSIFVLDTSTLSGSDKFKEGVAA